MKFPKNAQQKILKRNQNACQAKHLVEQENIKPINTQKQSYFHSKQQKSLDIGISINEKKQPILDNLSTLPYHKEIIAHLMGLSTNKNLTSHNYFDFQQDITEHMRAVLLNWLVDVHLKYKLKPETLFITMNIVDDYLSHKSIHRSKLQLLGITSLWIAAKYEQTYQIPKLQNLTFICDQTYTSKQILEMQGQILLTCQFQVLKPISISFYDFLNAYLGIPDKQYNLGKYLLELTLFDIHLRKYSSCLVVLAVIYFINKLLSFSKTGLNFTSIMASIGLNLNNQLQKQIKQCARDICLLWQKSYQNHHVKSLKNKYAQSKYHNASMIKLNQYTKNIQ